MGLVGWSRISLTSARRRFQVQSTETRVRGFHLAYRLPSNSNWDRLKGTRPISSIGLFDHLYRQRNFMIDVDDVNINDGITMRYNYVSIYRVGKRTVANDFWFRQFL